MPGRPRQFDRDAALCKARDLFWTRGYEGTSMADLVEALGLASARIYAAFGSKEALFREAVDLYQKGEGGFASRALMQEPRARDAIARIFEEAIALYTAAGNPRGCMVVAAATNCSASNGHIRDWLADRRRAQTDAIVKRLEFAVAEGELSPSADPQVLGDLLASLLHGMSVQARDGVPRERLLALIPKALEILPQ